MELVCFETQEFLSDFWHGRQVFFRILAIPKEKKQ
jgi:hypothetical protein